MLRLICALPKAPPTKRAVPCDAGEAAACTRLSDKVAERAWLAKLDAPTWGAVAAAVSEVARAVAAAGTDAEAAEEAARQAWTAWLDTPVWRTAAAALDGVADVAAAASDDEEGGEAGEATRRRQASTMVRRNAWPSAPASCPARACHVTG